MEHSAQRRVGPLRIAMVIPPWYEIPPRGYGGIEAVCADLVDALDARGHDVTVIGAGAGAGAAGRFLSTMRDLQHHRLGEAIPVMLHAARVESLLGRHDFDVIHDHSPAGPLTAAHRAAPTVVTVHGSVDDDLGDFLDAAGPGFHPVAISDAQRRSRGLRWAGTVHNGIDTGRLPALEPHDGPVVWLARFSPDKGPDLAVRACRAAGLRLVLAGKCNEPAELRYLQEEIRPMLGDDVHLLVNADRPTTQRLLRRARCLLLPIRWREPFGMVMIEALASGTPVVALRRGSVPEIVRPGVTGFVCDEPEVLPFALRHAAELDPRDCLADVRTRFGADLMARRYEQIYARVIAQARRSQVVRAVPWTPSWSAAPQLLR